MYGLTRVEVRTVLGSHCGQAVVKIAVLGVLVSSLMEREAAIEGFVPCQGGDLPGCQGSALRPVLCLQLKSSFDKHLPHSVLI